MQQYHRAFVVSRVLCLFDKWFPQAKQPELLHKGAAPHLHDDLHRQLISAARGNLNTSWLDELRGTMSRPHAQHPTAPCRTNPNPAPSGPKACAYCLGDHQTSQHPAEEPITQPCPNSPPISSPLPALLLRKFGIDHAVQVVRTCASASVHIPDAYANRDGADRRPIYSADGTAYQKLVLAQLAAGLGLTAAPRRVPEAELRAFMDGLRVVRRSLKPSVAREAANRRYLELGCRGDCAPPTMTGAIPPGHTAGWQTAPLMSPHAPSDLKAQLLKGAPLKWTGRPPRSRKNNYKSCFDNNDAAGVNFDRIIALGFREGPLHYLPCIVPPIAFIIKTEPTYKVRNVVDLGRRANPCSPAGRIDNLSAQATSAMPRMSGDGPRDPLRLRQLHDGFVRPHARLLLLLRRAWRHPLSATLGLLRGYIYHCTSDRSLTPSTIAGRLAAISEWHRRQLPHLRLAGRSALNPCKDESINTLISILERRTRMCITFINLGCLRRAAAAALACDYRVSSSGAVSYTYLSAVRVLLNAELGCRYIRLRVDVDKNVDARHECFAYIPYHVPCLVVRPVDMLEDYLRVFRPPSGSRLLAASKSSRIGPQTFHTTPYSGFNSAFKAAYARAFPDPATRTTPLDRVGSHSGRKSLAQCLWDCYRSAGVIAHVGHWACRQDAMDAYFKTSATEILLLIAAL
eukprot:jgi/Tetstr1/421045/TSEL_012090.t1